MPDTPDFDQIACRLHETVGCDHGTDAETVAAQVAMIVEQLRQVWNARGAADLEAIDAHVTYDMGGHVEGSRRGIERALRSLDR